MNNKGVFMFFNVLQLIQLLIVTCAFIVILSACENKGSNSPTTIGSVGATATVPGETVPVPTEPTEVTAAVPDETVAPVPTEAIATVPDESVDSSIPKINYSCMCDPDSVYTDDRVKRIYAINSVTVMEAQQEITQACHDLKSGEQQVNIFACYCTENGSFTQCD